MYLVGGSSITKMWLPPFEFTPTCFWRIVFMDSVFNWYFSPDNEVDQSLRHAQIPPKQRIATFPLVFHLVCMDTPFIPLVWWPCNICKFCCSKFFSFSAHIVLVDWWCGKVLCTSLNSRAETDKGACELPVENEQIDCHSFGQRTFVLELTTSSAHVGIHWHSLVS